MPWLLADRRDTALLVAGAENGTRVLTRSPRQAQAFANPEAARTWAMGHLFGDELEATVLRNARPILSRKKNPAQAGQPGGAIQRNFSDEDSAFSRQASQAG